MYQYENRNQVRPPQSRPSASELEKINDDVLSQIRQLREKVSLAIKDCQDFHAACDGFSATKEIEIKALENKIAEIEKKEA